MLSVARFADHAPSVGIGRRYGCGLARLMPISAMRSKLCGRGLASAASFKRNPSSTISVGWMRGAVHAVAACRSRVGRVTLDGPLITAGGQSRKGKMVHKRAAESLTEKGLAYHRHLKGKQPGYVASVEGRRLLDE